MGLTAKELAAKVDVVPTYISKLESKNILPAPIIIVRISEVLREDFIMDYIKEKDPVIFKAFFASFMRRYSKLFDHEKQSRK